MNTQHVKIPRLLGAAAALGVAGAFLLPASTQAWTTIGGSLGLGERHYRVYNNFTDPTANDNTLPDTNFPGYLGAPLAMWKAYLEWGSRLHGSGNGDPHQPGGLGSGGANFDPNWQGLATGVGGPNDNIASELAGSSGGVLAFTETPIQDGWRMRFYSVWTWNDGPTTPGSQMDIQGVACHEFGHALGLGHTGSTGATMEAAVSGNAVSQRSIATDDINGVQAIYGVASATKPIISGVSTTPGQVTITGSNFASSGNEVWFTQAGTGGNGTAVKVTNVVSDGLTITIAVPVTAGPGDVMVKVPGSANDDLSNAWPFAPDSGPPCNPPFNTCFTSPNSVDPVGSVLGYAGSQSIANNDLVLIATACPPNTAGLFYFGNSETFAVFGNGFRCVASPVVRLGIIHANIFGDAVYSLNVNAAPVAGNISAGQTKYFQFWYRNPAGGGAGFNLSDALAVPFCL